MIERATAAHWVERWDRQQEHYAEHREARFAAVVGLVERGTASQSRPVVVDIGAGPGSLSARLAAAMPHALVVAVESDPFLASLARAWCGGSVAIAVETAGSPGWRERLGLGQVGAVVASSALHYPAVPTLHSLYADVREWLAPGGIVVNADHFEDLADPGTPYVPPSIQPWVDWWRDAEAAPELAPILATRPEAPTVGEGEGDNGLTAGQHRVLLQDAGFGGVEVAWRRGRSGVLVAQRPGPPPS